MLQCLTSENNEFEDGSYITSNNIESNLSLPVCKVSDMSLDNASADKSIFQHSYSKCGEFIISGYIDA